MKLITTLVLAVFSTAAFSQTIPADLGHCSSIMAEEYVTYNRMEEKGEKLADANWPALVLGGTMAIGLVSIAALSPVGIVTVPVGFGVLALTQGISARKLHKAHKNLDRLANFRVTVFQARSGKEEIFRTAKNQFDGIQLMKAYEQLDVINTKRKSNGDVPLTIEEYTERYPLAKFDPSTLHNQITYLATELGSDYDTVEKSIVKLSETNAFCPNGEIVDKSTFTDLVRNN